LKGNRVEISSSTGWVFLGEEDSMRAIDMLELGMARV
jgi:hypothetical protein